MKLKDFQISGRDFLKEKKKALLQMGCGMGKSQTALSAVPERSKVLIFTPPRLALKWLEEIEKSGRFLNATFLKRTRKEQISEALHLTNEVKYLIIDEAHEALRNWQKSKELIRLAKKIENVYFLTASPLIHSAEDMYWILKICGVFNLEKSKFIEKFMGGKYIRSIDRIVPTQKLTNKEEFLNLKRQITYSYGRVEHINKSYICLGESPIKSSNNILTFSREEEMLGLLRINKSFEKIKDLFLIHSKIVFFFMHKSVGVRAKQFLKKEGFKTLYVDGQTSEYIRRNHFKTFEGFNGKVAFLINSKACGAGVDIYGANACCFIQRTWSEGTDYQCYMRAYRFERKKPLNVYFLYFRAEKKEEVIAKKRELFKA